LTQNVQRLQDPPGDGKIHRTRNRDQLPNVPKAGDGDGLLDEEDGVEIGLHHGRKGGAGSETVVELPRAAGGIGPHPLTGLFCKAEGVMKRFLEEPALAPGGPASKRRRAPASAAAAISSSVWRLVVAGLPVA
jgi:hypothetical protein